MKTRLLLLLFLALPATAGAQKGATHFVISDELPRLQIQVADNFAWLGDATFPVDTIAVAREVVYGIVDDGVLTRALIIRFEHYYPGLSQTFSYPPGPTVQLGGQPYLHGTWAFGNLWLFQQPEVMEMTQKVYLTVGTRWVMDRYIRVLPENPQYQVVIYYLESDFVSDPSITYGDEPVVPPLDVIPPIVQRAQASFTILPQ